MTPRGHIYPQVTSARLLTAAFNVAVGLRMLWPDDILGTVPGYRLMNVHFFGDVPFGLALLVYGTVMAVGLRSGPGWKWPAIVATWLSLLTWLIVAGDIAYVNPSQIGSLAYVLIAAMNGYAYAHLIAWHQQRHS